MTQPIQESMASINKDDWPRLGVSSHKIIVGIDYGTTYTGVSYVSTASQDIKDIVVIGTWPGPSRNAETVFKAPSRIAYPFDNPQNSDNRWGFQVAPGMTAYSWTKLLLDQSTPLGRFDDASLEHASAMGIIRLPRNKSAVEVVADFLTGVREHVFNLIEKQVTKEALRITPIEFWLTVPAIWSDLAKAQTRAAAQAAGFGKSAARPDDEMFMITEPEAAAIAALKKTTTDGLGASVKPGDGVLVCDCGGGTVDITTYLIKKVEPVLLFEELCVGTGGKCGSTAIDRNFYGLMLQRFGEDFEKLSPKKKGPGSEFMRKFEMVKKDFGFSPIEEVHEIPLNMTVTYPELMERFFDEEERLVLITNEDLKRLFDPVVKRIIWLVCRQIQDANAESGRSSINRIILVGGFGDSEYLRQAFKNAFANIVITVPDNPQAAIVKGAAIRGLQGLQATIKRCRRHYGFEWALPFRPGIDDEKHSFIDRFDGTKRVHGIMNWLINKKNQYADGHSCSSALAIKFVLGERRVETLELFTCDLDHAPERVDHEDVREVGEITLDLTNVDISCFECKIIAGKVMHEINIEVKVVFSSRDGALKFETTCQGRVIGRTTINFASARYY